VSPKAVSKSQQRLLYALEARGELKPGTARRHARKGAAYAALPERKTKKRRRKRRRR
jgi:hypothetical protein